jgi:hypothetical protein
LVASRRFITSAFGVTKINNKYITAISVPQNDTPYVWFIIIRHENCLEYCLNYLGVLIDELLTEIYSLLRKIISFIDVFLRDLLECLYLFFIFILTLIGGFIMPPGIRSEPRNRQRSQFKAFDIIFSILDFLQDISTKLNDLKEVNQRLIVIDEKVAYLKENSDIIMQNMNDINNTSLMSRYEEIIRENQYLQMQAQEKDETIIKQRKYIQELANEIEQVSKYLPSEKDENKKFTISDITEMYKSLQEIAGKANTFISKITNNDLSGGKFEGILNIDGTHHGNQTGTQSNPPKPEREE